MPKIHKPGVQWNKLAVKLLHVVLNV